MSEAKVQEAQTIVVVVSEPGKKNLQFHGLNITATAVGALVVDNGLGNVVAVFAPGTWDSAYRQGCFIENG